MKVDLEDEAVIAGVARGFKEFLAESGAGARFGEMIEALAGLQLLKDSLLTADQVCRLYQISRSTFDRAVAAKELRKEEGLGYAEPRFWLFDVLAMLQKKHRPAAADPQGEEGRLLNVVDLPGVAAPRRRRQKKAA